MQEEKYNAGKPITKMSVKEARVAKKVTQKDEYCVTGYYIREYVHGLENAINRAQVIARRTKRWGKVELILAKKPQNKIVQKFICMWDGEGLDVDFTEI